MGGPACSVLEQVQPFVSALKFLGCKVKDLGFGICSLGMGL